MSRAMPSSAIATGVLACVLAWTAPSPVLAADPPLIEYTVVHHMLADADPRPLLRVWPDGRVHAHFPVYMTRAGDYELKLSAAELSDLLATLEATGLFALDLDAAQDVRKARGDSLHHVSDVTETVIRIRSTATGRAPVLTSRGPIDLDIRWANVRRDRLRFPDLEGVAAVDDAEQLLRKLLKHPALRRTAP